MMVLEKNSIYALDECSVLHLCKINIPESYRVFFENNFLCYKNYNKLNMLMDAINSMSLQIYRFEFEDIEKNVISVANELLENTGNVSILPQAFKAKIIEQIEEFKNSVEIDFIIIPKDSNINRIIQLFKDNEKELKKDTNIPNDDDCAVLGGYIKFSLGEGRKYLISHDEHFWGYKSLIKNNFDIIVVEEWNCHILAK